MSNTENINHEIMFNETETTDLDEKFNNEFFNGELGTPVISFECTGYKTFCHFIIGRNAIGAKWNIKGIN